MIKAVEGLYLNVNKGQVLGLVGESGCGKTVTAFSVLNLIPPKAKIEKGEIFFKGKDLLKVSNKEMRKVRGKKISMIFQEPLSALNPVYTVGFQISEMLDIHRRDIPRRQKERFILDLLAEAELKEPQRILKSYPNALSGGQAQRVLTAMAICCNPDLLIADEPTTALDVTIQAQIINLFKKLKDKENLTFIFISHDLRVCSQLCDRIAVMYAGKIVEVAQTADILTKPAHPYTKALLLSVPGNKSPKERLSVIKGNVPDAACKPSGCHFKDRCSQRIQVCNDTYPDIESVSSGHWVRCFRKNG